MSKIYESTITGDFNDGYIQIRVNFKKPRKTKRLSQKNCTNCVNSNLYPKEKEEFPCDMYFCDVQEEYLDLDDLNQVCDEYEKVEY